MSEDLLNNQKARLHNKLVRDKIPEYLKEKGIEPEVEIITDQVRLLRLLLDKLEEEAQEAGLITEEGQAGDGKLLEELADLESVIDGILKLKGLTRKQVDEKQKSKDKERGQLFNGVFLEYTIEKEEK